MWPHRVFRAPVVWPSAPPCYCPHLQHQLPLLSLRSFAFRPHGRTAAKAAVEQEQLSDRSFGELNLGRDLLSALSQQQLISPTEIQVAGRRLARLSLHASDRRSELLGGCRDQRSLPYFKVAMFSLRLIQDLARRLRTCYLWCVAIYLCLAIVHD